jgi:hypothetical protein
VELQVSPVTSALAAAPAAPQTAVNARNATGSAAAVGADGSATGRDGILSDPNEAYRTQIREALIDTMLEHSRGLSIGPNELLTVAARGIYDRPRLAGVDTDSRTHVISVRGADLTAFLGGQLSREEARQRVEVRVF